VAEISNSTIPIVLLPPPQETIRSLLLDEHKTTVSYDIASTGQRNRIHCMRYKSIMQEIHLEVFQRALIKTGVLSSQKHKKIRAQFDDSQTI